MPQPSYGELFGIGIKYLKVNRFDSGGLDRSDYLGQLTNLTINYNDLGPIQYNIITTQEQSDYFVYGIQTKNQSTSSVNFTTLDYSWFIQSSSAFTLGISPGNLLANLNLIDGNTLNYLDIPNGTWNFNSTPNNIIKLQISGNASWNVPASSPIFSLVNSYNNETIISEFLLGTGPTNDYDFNTTIILSSSYYYPIENDSIKLFLGKPGAGTYTINKLYISASFYNTSSFNGSSSLVIFNPEFINWDYNDYNALYGNAEIAQFSNHFMDVDYITNQTTPINFDLIISGTADKAFVQDSNYASSAWSNIRYKGSRTNSFKFI